MKINETCPLFMTDLYFYDFKACYPRLLNSINWDFGDVDLENKTERNIHIGKLQSKHKHMYSFLSNSVDNLIEFYTSENNIQKENLIVSQKDGFITNKYIENTDSFLKLDFRGHIEWLLITTDRRKYMYKLNNKIIVKGISNIYDEIEKFYNKFTKLNIYNKKSIFRFMENIKNDIIHGQDKKLYMININDMNIVQSTHGTTRVKDETIFSLSDINMKKYFDHYIKEFLDSLFLAFY